MKVVKIACENMARGMSRGPRIESWETFKAKAEKRKPKKQT